LLLLVALPLVVLLPRRRLSATSRVMRGAVLAVRLAIVGLLLLALSEPSLRPLGQARSVVFALDASDSLSPEQRQWERGWMLRAVRALPPGSLWQAIDFGDYTTLDGTGDNPPPGASTDLAAALRMAGAVAARGQGLAPEIVLFTDGW